MAALQLVSHLEGDALNVALLVPESQRVLPGVLVGHCRSMWGGMVRRGDTHVSLRGPPGVQVTIRRCSP